MHDEEVVMTPSWFTRVLALGDSGGDVELVQRKLHASTSGTYDTATEARVRGFQKYHGLLVTGVVDASTADVLGESIRHGMIPDWYFRDLAPGDQGIDVARVRELLGLSPGRVVFDTHLEVALRRFQSAHGLISTGVISEQDAIVIGDDVPWYKGDMMNPEAHSL